MDQQPKFNKTFDALYNIAMKAADECIVNQDLESRFSKLEEEYKELIEAYSVTGENPTTKPVISELSDVMFVLMHIAYLFGVTPFELLHMGLSKMILRMNDPNYIAKQ